MGPAIGAAKGIKTTTHSTDSLSIDLLYVTATVTIANYAMRAMIIADALLPGLAGSSGRSGRPQLTAG